ncbi:hypothetical protein F4809DRAFT_632546 [Biscogniauxia mediterranea]|nr:hypothetical protein F4809DRAFT_632546 [Biscogniauxia mediterranea]
MLVPCLRFELFCLYLLSHRKQSELHCFLYFLTIDIEPYHYHLVYISNLPTLNRPFRPSFLTNSDFLKPPYTISPPTDTDVQTMDSTATTTNSSSSTAAPLLYFAYGSNLSTAQMRARCPVSEPLALAHLAGWSWIINERGYANIVKNAEASSSPPPASSATAPPLGVANQGTSAEEKEEAPGGGVYGLLYRLDPSDELALDACEGVPWAYERRLVDVAVAGALAVPASENKGRDDGLRAGSALRGVLAYVDDRRVGPSRPKPEYVGRMNGGIEEAVSVWGLPREYVDGVMRRFIPEM